MIYGYQLLGNITLDSTHDIGTGAAKAGTIYATNLNHADHQITNIHATNIHTYSNFIAHNSGHTNGMVQFDSAANKSYFMNSTGDQHIIEVDAGANFITFKNKDGVRVYEYVHSLPVGGFCEVASSNCSRRHSYGSHSSCPRRTLPLTDARRILEAAYRKELGMARDKKKGQGVSTDAAAHGKMKGKGDETSYAFKYSTQWNARHDGPCVLDWTQLVTSAELRRAAKALGAARSVYVVRQRPAGTSMACAVSSYISRQAHSADVSPSRGCDTRTNNTPPRAMLTSWTA